MHTGSGVTSGGPTRRYWIARSLALLAAVVSAPVLAARDTGGSTAVSPGTRMLTVYTFGDSILDCGHYNAHGVHPGQLLVRNDDALFPEFKGKDLLARGPARLEHLAVDGATVAGLPAQAQRAGKVEGPSLAMLTVGGNDLLRGLAADSGAGLRAFEASLDRFLAALPIRPVLLGNVYDPTFGDDSRNFLPIEPGLARENLRRVNEVIAAMAERYGKLVDLHAHFLRGDPSWFVHTIEPSLTGASEVRRAFLAMI
jgi:acyl-CoA thioesterase-1